MASNKIIYLLRIKQTVEDNVRIVGAYKKLNSLKEEIIFWHADAVARKNSKNKKVKECGWEQNHPPDSVIENSRKELKTLLSKKTIDKLYTFSEAKGIISNEYGVTASFNVENVGLIFISKVLLE